VSRVVVVGAGVGGLAAAARLAALGHDVELVEQAETVGGKLGRYERDGFVFDTGPSLLTLPATFRDLFMKTRKHRRDPAFDDAVELVPLDPVARYRFADGTLLDLPGGDLPQIRAAIDAALGAGAGDDWLHLLAHAERVWDVTRRPFVESALDGPSTLLRLAARQPGDLLTVAPWRSLRDVGRRHLRDPRLRLLLDRYATYTGSDPRRAPAALAVVPYVEQRFGAWYVRGGLHRITDALHERAVSCGVRIRTGATVTVITTAGGRVDGVRLGDREHLPADVVVSDVDARRLYAELLPRTDQLRRLSRATPSLSGFVLLLGIRGRTPGTAHHTVLFPADYDAEFDAIFGREPRPVDDPTIYVSAPDDASLAPPGAQAWFVLVNAPRHDPARGVDWDAPGLAAGYADRLLALMADRGLDVRDRLACYEWRTPADLERATCSPGGSIYGTSSNGARAAFLRPANRSPVPGLFLVGGSAHPGGGLPLVAQSAAIGADRIGPA
jgi:phytoene desaturase